MATPIRGSKGKGDTTSAVRVGTARSGGIRKVGRPSGYGGRIATSSRGGLADASLGANNRSSGGKGAPGTGLSGGGSAGGAIGGGVTSTTTQPGGTPVPSKPSSGTGSSAGSGSPLTGGSGGGLVETVNPDHATLDSTFAAAMPLTSTRLASKAVPISGPTASLNTAARTPAKSTAQVSNGTVKTVGSTSTARKTSFSRSQTTAYSGGGNSAGDARRKAGTSKASQNKNKRYAGPTGKAGVAQAKARAAAATAKAKAAAAAKKKAATSTQGTHGTNRGALR